MTIENLLRKYDREVPRYTSYPTVPFWEKLTDTGSYIDNFKTRFEKYNQEKGISLYIHLPFCESLCTYCGCNKIITANHRVEEEYLNAIIDEWYLYRKLIPANPVIRELHLGGGTPTFFSPGNLRRLLNCLFDVADIHHERTFSIEAHPNNTTKAHLEVLQHFGFSRLSLGIQDHNEDVQRIINRVQSFDQVKKVTEDAREAGFTSINYDLIYGLPLQTIESIQKTAEETIALRPDRISYYSYAHVPWKIKAQRLYDEKDLPSATLKMKFYLLARSLFLSAGYTDIGMDHFSLPGEDLCIVSKKGQLYRNFMGYTSASTPFLIGLGVSAISDTGSAYAQNYKELSNYYFRLRKSELPLYRGYVLSRTDLGFRDYIMDIACKGHTAFKPEDKNILNKYVMPVLKEMKNDGLIEADQNHLILTDKGKLFLRNICQAFDLKWKLSLGDEKQLRFSRSV